MSRDSNLYLEDILQSITRILNWTQGMTLEQFQADELVRDAVLHNLEIMGEAVKGLSDEITVANPNIPWRVIGDFRNRIAHGYFSVDLGIVWNVIQIRLPDLRDGIAHILAGRNAEGQT
jgi:uncharacterized protein with HEPN domain